MPHTRSSERELCYTSCPRVPNVRCRGNMKDRMKEAIPATRSETVRRQIIDLLASGTYSARDLSAEAHIPEKEVYGHLDHIRKSLAREGRAFTIIGPECRKCGFLFTRMDRLRRPGKCPKCRGETIHEPRFRITGEVHPESSGRK